MITTKGACKKMTLPTQSTQQTPLALIIKEVVPEPKDESLFELRSILEQRNEPYDTLDWYAPSTLERGSGRVERLENKPVAQLSKLQQGDLVINGSGFYHDRTFYLVQHFCEQQLQGRSLAYVHIDAHTDMRDEDYEHQQRFSSASFVSAIAKLPKIQEICFIGTTYQSAGLGQAKQKGLVFEEDAKAFTASAISNPFVYVSIDLDVLEGFNSPWPGGQMPLERLVEIVQEIGAHKHIIGADITGFSKEFACWNDKRLFFEVYTSLCNAM
ncbi:hypothetical protein D6774_03375 [Candidatus Woesearchaeota archaeon]|nr:MAG: hypothetical protein D6774_03375 [Candidatus Woesearchaeota archaeon]